MLPKKFDRKKTYWKVTNEDECHYGLQYKTGLVVDPIPFNDNPNLSCVEGGIYFTTKDYIHKYFWKGTNLRSVRIPEDARVVLDSSGNKYRADKITLGGKKDLNHYFNNLFDKKTFPKKDYWYLAKYCPKHFDKWFDKKILPKIYYRYLAIYYSDYFDKWFDKDIFPKEYYWCLAKYCPKHFDKWFDKETFPKDYYRFLARHCSEHFDKWFSKKTFPKKDYEYLKQYCYKYKYIWEK